MSVTPDFVGQVYKDTNTGNIWRANSLTQGDWTLECSGSPTQVTLTAGIATATCFIDYNADPDQNTGPLVTYIYDPVDVVHNFSEYLYASPVNDPKFVKAPCWTRLEYSSRRRNCFVNKK